MLRRIKKLLSQEQNEILRERGCPPPYSENSPQVTYASGERERDRAIGNDNDIDGRHFSSQVEGYISDAVGALDLLSSCKNISNEVGARSTGVGASEMGNKHTSLFASQHRSKISLTWVLREQGEGKDVEVGPRIQEHRHRRRSDFATVDRYQRHNQKFEEKSTYERVAGRKDYSQRPRSHSKAERPCGGTQSSSGSSAGERSVSQRKHRHRRRCRSRDSDMADFGYDIKDIDYFLTEATIDNPGNIPVVVTYPSILYQTQGGNQIEWSLQLGMVVNAVFKKKQWLYVQTPHGEEGYVEYCACLPLGILPPLDRSKSNWISTPCWESSKDLYPRPCGNMTDSEKEHMRSAQSECGRRSRSKAYVKKYPASTCGEHTFDKLYIKATNMKNSSGEEYDLKANPQDCYSSSKRSTMKRKVQYVERSHRKINRHFLLYVNSDYEGNEMENTLSVKEKEVVILIKGSGVEADVDAEWFYVRKNDGSEGFIPAAITGHGFL